MRKISWTLCAYDRKKILHNKCVCSHALISTEPRWSQLFTPNCSTQKLENWKISLSFKSHRVRAWWCLAGQMWPDRDYFPIVSISTILYTTCLHSAICMSCYYIEHFLLSAVFCNLWVRGRTVHTVYTYWERERLP